LQNYIMVGDLRLPWYLIAFIAAYLIGSFVLKKITDPEDNRGAWAEKHILNSLLIGLIIWKISPLLFNFSTVSTNFQALLFLPGGVPGIITGVIGAGGYYTLMLFRRKNRMSENLKTSGLYLLIMGGIGGSILLLLLIFGPFIPGSSTNTSQNTSGVNQKVEIKAGTPAPDFRLVSLSGDEYSPNELHGKWIVLNFWASWCPPCKAELPELLEFYDEINKSDGIARSVLLLGINLIRSEKNPESLPGFIKEQKIDFPILSDTTGEISELYQIESIPTTIIIDQEGIIRSVRVGAVTRQWLESQVK